jgi:hypothetical protein
LKTSASDTVEKWGDVGTLTGLYAEPRRSMLVCTHANPSSVTQWLE